MYNYPIEMEINGTRIKAPKVNGIIRKKEKIWSKNTGRTASGRMQGTIIAIKTTYSFEWIALTHDDQERIEMLISDKTVPFSTVRIRKPTGDVHEFECYFGTPTFAEWSKVNGEWRCTSAKVDAIER